MSKKITTEEFIEKAREVHGNKYDYSKVDYVSNHTKVCIICPEHGEFLQEPIAHLRGQNCPICGRKIARDKLSKGRDKFIEAAKLIHGDRYDYSKVEYVNSDTKVTIICPIHGEFEIQPKHHLSGCGCQKCKRGENAKKLTLTTEEFIEKARKVHGDKYDYSKVEYVNSHKKVCIICPIHGEFMQAPNDHLNGRGCRICSESKLEAKISNLLNENKIVYERQKMFFWLGRKSLDFYLPNYNIAIECQGIQHFQEVKHFKDKFNEIKERDKIKKKLCDENGVRILYYSDLKIEYPYEVITNTDELINMIKSCTE
jgi:very-short-patch-repair endonuclease